MCAIIFLRPLYLKILDPPPPPPAIDYKEVNFSFHILFFHAQVPSTITPGPSGDKNGGDMKGVSYKTEVVGGVVIKTAVQVRECSMLVILVPLPF